MHARKTNARTKFTAGPAADILPFLILPTGPLIMTAPGAAIIKPRKLRSIANMSILSSDLNSAKHP